MFSKTERQSAIPHFSDILFLQSGCEDGYFQGFCFVSVSHKELKFKDFDIFLKGFLIPPGSNNHLPRALSYQYTCFLVPVASKNQTSNPGSRPCLLTECSMALAMPSADAAGPDFLLLWVSLKDLGYLFIKPMSFTGLKWMGSGSSLWSRVCGFLQVSIWDKMVGIQSEGPASLPCPAPSSLC